MRFARTATTLTVLSLSIAGCGTAGEANSHGLKFNVIGTCSTIGGDLTTQSSGFTAHGAYKSTVTGPDGKATAGPGGKASSTGTTPNWRFDCYRAKPGNYKVIITDESTGKTANDTFTVKEV